MQVVFHCGIHRTGSSSLQKFLADNRENLVAQGVHYPGEETHHQHLAWALKHEDISAEDVLATVSDTPGDVDTVILSAEDFCILTDLGWVEKIRQTYPIHAVFYLRRQDHWVMSWYNQHVKWPFEPRKAEMDPAAFLSTLEDFYWLDFARLVGRWESVLGYDNVSIAVVERGQVENVLTDFLARVGIESAGLSFDRERVNDSLPVHVLEIARHLGLAKMAPAKRYRLLNALTAGLSDKAPEAKTVFSPEERQQVLNRFAGSNRRVAERYFGREDLFLEPPPPPDALYFRLPEMPRGKLMRQWVAPVISELLDMQDRR